MTCTAKAWSFAGRGWAGAAVALLGACAHPATDTVVPSMPMRSALEQARADASAFWGARDGAQPPAPERPAGTPRAMIRAPEVRLAYLYEWIDAEGNKHFGEWVAIPITGFDWVMTDGSRPPLDGQQRPVPGEVH